MRHLLRVADFPHDGLGDLSVNAREEQFVLGLLFTTPSMRTRVGFSVAASRLGGTPLLVDELRVDASMSAAESLEDAVRTLSGMVDALVIRTDQALDAEWIAAHAVCPVINGGDAEEHPSQALIDIHAIETFGGPLSELDVAVVGDLRMRSARSLLRRFAQRPPRSLTLIAPPTRGADVDLARIGARRLDRLVDLRDADVVVMVGLPPRRGDDVLADAARAEFVLTTEILDRQAPTVIALNPMPAIDELGPGVREDPRCRMFEQSDLAVGVRMALLNWCLDGATPRG